LECKNVASGVTRPKKFCSRKPAAINSAGTKITPTASTTQPAMKPASRPSPARTMA
jgi:hypothetical protein